MNILPHISNFDGILPKFRITKDPNKHIPDKIYLEGCEVFSLLLPTEVNYHKSVDDDDNILIVNGKLISGKCDSSVTGRGSGSLVHIIQNLIMVFIIVSFVVNYLTIPPRFFTICARFSS